MTHNQLEYPAQREAFEKWRTMDNKHVSLARIDADGDYEFEGTATMWKAWQAAYNARGDDKLRDAIIVLEDDAEPEVGDLVLASWVDEQDSEWEHQGGEYLTITSRRPNALGGKDFYEGQKPCRDSNWNLWPGTAMKIIRRAGKPCIYRSELAAYEQAKEIYDR